MEARAFTALVLGWRDQHSRSTSDTAVATLLQLLFHLLKGASGADSTAVPADSFKQLLSPFRHVHTPPQWWGFCGNCPEPNPKDNCAIGRPLFKFVKAGGKLLTGENPVCSRCQHSCVRGRTDAAGNDVPFAAPVHCGDYVPLGATFVARFSDPVFAEAVKGLNIPAAAGDFLRDWTDGALARRAVAAYPQFFAVCWNLVLFISFDGVDLQKTGRHGNRKSSDLFCIFYGNLPAALRRNPKFIDLYFAAARVWGHADCLVLHAALCEEFRRAFMDGFRVWDAHSGQYVVVKVMVAGAHSDGKARWVWYNAKLEGKEDYRFHYTAVRDASVNNNVTSSYHLFLDMGDPRRLDPATGLPDPRPVPQLKTQQDNAAAVQRVATQRAAWARRERGAKGVLDALLTELGIFGPSPYERLPYFVSNKMIECGSPWDSFHAGGNVAEIFIQGLAGRRLDYFSDMEKEKVLSLDGLSEVQLLLPNMRRALHVGDNTHRHLREVVKDGNGKTKSGALKSTTHEKIKWMLWHMLFQAKGRISMRALEALSKLVAAWRIVLSRSIPRASAEGLMQQIAAALTAAEPYLGTHDRKGRAMCGIIQAPWTLLEHGPPANVDAASAEHAYGDLKATAKSQAHLTASVSNAAAMRNTVAVLRWASPVVFAAFRDVALLQKANGPQSFETDLDGTFSYPVAGAVLTEDDVIDMIMHLIKLEFPEAAATHLTWVNSRRGKAWELQNPGRPLDTFEHWVGAEYADHAGPGSVLRLRDALSRSFDIGAKEFSRVDVQNRGVYTVEGNYKRCQWLRHAPIA